MKINNNDMHLKRKVESLNGLLVIAIYMSPLIILGIVTFIYGLISGDFSFFITDALFFGFFYLLFYTFIKRYTNFLIYGRETIIIPKEEVVEEEKNIVSVVDMTDNNSRVEGIIGYRERDIVDKDDDGYILVHEFYPLTESDVLFKLMQKDNHFSKKDFSNYVKELFLLMQEAWSNNDYLKLRSFEADRLYYRHKREIERLIAEGESDIRENISIKGVMLKDFRIENNKQILVVALTAHMIRSYGLDIEEDDFPYIMAFSRNVGVKTNTKVKLSIKNCCNCGAPVNVSDEGVCKYCDTSVVSGEHDWVLVDMKLINIDMDFKSKKKN